VMGQAVTNTWLRAREWNETKRKTDPPASEWLMLSLTTIYFISDFMLIGVLEIPLALAGDYKHWAAMLFPLAQVIATLATGERATQYRREAAVLIERTERRQARARKQTGNKPGNKPGNDTGKNTRHTALTSDDTRQQARAILAERPGISGSELGRQLDRSPRLGRMLKAELLPEIQPATNGKNHN